MKSDKLKQHLVKDNWVNIVLSVLIVGLTFAMLYLAPLRSDDWAWGIQLDENAEEQHERRKGDEPSQ